MTVMIELDYLYVNIALSTLKNRPNRVNTVDTHDIKS